MLGEMDIRKVAGTEYSWDGEKLTNLDSDIDYKQLSFEKKPFYEKLNQEHKSYKGKGIQITAYTSVKVPEFIEGAAGWFVQKFMTGLLRISAALKDQSWEWIDIKVFKSSERIDVPYWFDKVVYRIEWTLKPLSESLDGGLGFVFTVTASIGLGIVIIAAAAAIGLVIGMLRISSKDIGKTFSRTMLAAVVLGGVYLYTQFRSS